MKKVAAGIIDASRGFMPLEEGQRLNLPGFGELPIDGGHEIVPVINKIISCSGIDLVFTTQDWHPKETAHFSENPDFETTWPVHCVAGSPGAELHPDLILGEEVIRFIKGYETLLKGEDDLSYSGFNAVSVDNPTITLHEYLAETEITDLILAGLALDYCVGKTALDFARKTRINVSVIMDATRSVSEVSADKMIREMGQDGVRIVDSRQIIRELMGDAQL